MRRTLLVAIISLLFGTIGTTAHASLTTGTLLTLDPAVHSCYPKPRDGTIGVWPDCGLVGGYISSGSYFAMGDELPSSKVGLNPGPDGGIIMGVSQPASGSHGGFPNGTENPSVDAPWAYFGSTGMHFTATPVTVIDEDVNGDGGITKTLDLSGWNVTWNGIPAIPIGGVATIVCSIADCPLGSFYELDYATIIPVSPLHGFGGVPYFFHSEGLVAVPAPTAMWLLGSGLLGLVGLARRKKK